MALSHASAHREVCGEALTGGVKILRGQVFTFHKEPNIGFEDGPAVWLALNDYRNAKPVNGKEADFADALIVNKSKQVANRVHIPVSSDHRFHCKVDHLFLSKLDQSFLRKLDHRFQSKVDHFFLSAGID